MDKIKIKNLECFGNHGVFKEENILGQKFIISATLYIDTLAAVKDDDLNFSVNYGEVCQLISDIVKDNTFKLIETLANTIAMVILNKYNLVKKIKIIVKKPFAPIKFSIDTVSVELKRKKHIAYLSIGSNIGNKEYYLNQAIELLNENESCFVAKISDFIITKPYGYTNQDDFLNGAIEVFTTLDAFELLNTIHEIEKQLGRVRTIHWGPRTIDIDIILFDDEIINTNNLIIPHKEMEKRDFVLIPLKQIAPQKVHPILNKKIIELTV